MRFRSVVLGGFVHQFGFVGSTYAWFRDRSTDCLRCLCRVDCADSAVGTPGTTGICCPACEVILRDYVADRLFHNGICPAQIIDQEENDIGTTSSFCSQGFSNRQGAKNQAGDLQAKSQGMSFVCAGDSADCGLSFAGCCKSDGFGCRFLAAGMISRMTVVSSGGILVSQPS